MPTSGALARDLWRLSQRKRTSGDERLTSLSSHFEDYETVPRGGTAISTTITKTREALAMPTSGALARGWSRLSRRKRTPGGEGLTSPSSHLEDHDSYGHARDAAAVAATGGLDRPEAKKGNLVHRSMDRIRRSFRESFRRRSREHSSIGSPSESSPSGTPQPGGSGVAGSAATPADATKVEFWQPDEAAVREGTCSFYVKYLGAVEVFESRGMQICEGALKLLRTQRRRPVKAILCISGDGLRVVDQESNRGLIVDQTIEKVSFCAPDRNHDKGFAYICRDGSSRRWMCHGFHATKESGERLSHAVGCAFAVCLEKKKKRDAEATAAAQAAAGLLPPSGAEVGATSAGFTLHELTTASIPPPNPASLPSSSEVVVVGLDRQNPAYSSFRRQLSITERLRDPQTAILQEPPPFNATSSLCLAAKPRPAPNPLLFERQGSLRAPESSSAAAAAFRRQFSLRCYSTDSPLRQHHVTSTSSMSRNEPILERDEETLTWPEGSVISTCATVPAVSKPLSKLNGFSCSSEASPSATYNGICGAESRSVGPQSPLRVQTLCATPNSGPQSWSDMSCAGGAGSAMSSRSRADEWLEQTLRSSLSLNSSLKNADFLQRSNAFEESRSLESHSPVASTVSCSSPPESSAHDATASAAPSSFAKFNPDFSQYELPPITEGFTPTTETIAVTSSLDLFGQPAFNPVTSSISHTSPNKSFSEKSEQSNGSLNGYVAMRDDESDPFDVKWSELAMSRAVSYHETPVAVTPSTNPFYKESNAGTGNAANCICVRL